MALPTKSRLKKKSDFDKFRTAARTYRGSRLILKIAEGEDGGRRFGFIIPKKVGNAVVRNRIKRVLSEWIRTHFDRFPDGKDFLIIILSGPESTGKSARALAKQLERLAREALDDPKEA